MMYVLEFPLGQVEREADESKDDSQTGKQSHRVKSGRRYCIDSVLKFQAQLRTLGLNIYCTRYRTIN